MNPIEKLIKSINKDISYTISELVTKCNIVGIDISPDKIKYDIRHGYLKGFKLGQNTSAWYVNGGDFQKYLLSLTCAV